MPHPKPFDSPPVIVVGRHRNKKETESLLVRHFKSKSGEKYPSEEKNCNGYTLTSSGAKWGGVEAPHFRRRNAVGRVNEGGVLAEVILELVPVEKSRAVEGRERRPPSEQAQARCRAGYTELPKRSGRWSPAPFPLLPEPLASSVAISTCCVSVLFSVPTVEEAFLSPCLFFGVHQTLHLQTDEG